MALVINMADRGFVASVTPGFTPPKRKGKTREARRGKTGNRLKVKDRNGKVVLDHDSADSAKKNQDILDWMKSQGIYMPVTKTQTAKKRKTPPSGDAVAATESFMKSKSGKALVASAESGGDIRQKIEEAFLAGVEWAASE